MVSVLRPSASGANRLLACIREASVAVPKAPLTFKEQMELAARIRRFRTLPPQLQEGVLRYGEQLQNSYRS